MTTTAPHTGSRGTGEVDVGSRQAVALVARREITTRIRSKVFVISTIVMLISIIATVFISKAVSNKNTAQHVGFVAGQQSSATAFGTAARAVGQKVTTPTVASRAAGEQQLRDGKLDALVVGTRSGIQLEVKRELNDTLRNAFTVLVRQEALNQRLRQAGVDPADISKAVAAAHVDVHSLIPVDPHRSQRLAIAIIGGILVYVALLVYGQAVAQGVVEEKTSRIVELLLTAIRPWQLLLGKVIGIGALGLGQLIVVGVAGVLAGTGAGVLTLPSSVAAGGVISAFGWFLLGYLEYALMFAALGALVSRQEDVGGAVAPLSGLIIIPYIIGISTVPSNPDSALVAALSLIPLFSPTLMPMRLAGGVPGWEMGLAVALTVAFIALLIWFAGRIYGNAVTRTGSRVRLKDALRPI